MQGERLETLLMLFFISDQHFSNSLLNPLAVFFMGQQDC